MGDHLNNTRYGYNLSKHLKSLIVYFCQDLEVDGSRKKIGRLQNEYDILQIEKSDIIKEYQVKRFEIQCSR